MATLQELLSRLVEHEDLTAEETAAVMDDVLTDAASPVQVAAFLAALRVKRETPAEVAGLAQAMLDHAERFEVPGRTVDIVGTGGDGAHTVNISTMASLVIAGAGLTVVKHGNRAATSKSGSADVLAALGVRLDLSPQRVAELATEVGITFCFAAAHHPSMRHAAVTRRDLAIGTAFNALGPLTNPGQPTYAAVGVADARLAPLIAGVFAGRGRAAAVFRGDDGLDELTPATTSTVWWVADGGVTELSVAPSDVGLATAPVSALRGGDAAFNADVARRVLGGEAGPVRDAVVLNAGMALALPAAASGPMTRDRLVEVLAAGVASAEGVLDSGAAARVLADWAAVTTELAAG